MFKMLLREFLFIERFGDISFPFVDLSYYLRNVHSIYDRAPTSGKNIAE